MFWCRQCRRAAAYAGDTGKGEAGAGGKACIGPGVVTGIGPDTGDTGKKAVGSYTEVCIGVADAAGAGA